MNSLSSGQNTVLNPLQQVTGNNVRKHAMIVSKHVHGSVVKGGWKLSVQSYVKHA